MDRKAQSLDGSPENPNVSLSAEKNEEADYVNVPEGAEKNVRAAPVHLIAQFELKQLMTELDEVKKENQQLHEQNVSRAQWSVDEYCPKENNRKCSSCQKGWLLSQSSCYVVVNAEPPNQKTWKEAGEFCRGKSSDLTVVGDEEEKKFVKEKSWVNKNITGYWIGLRAEGGKWRWIDGSALINQAWIQQQPVDGQCVTSLQGREWRSVSCEEKNAWICEKKALSV